MDLKGAEIRNVNELCYDMNTHDTRPIKVIIPFYQRPYKWEEKHIKRLVSDFYNNDCDEYFVGSVVMVAPSEGFDKHSIIDGQQRITTLFLFEYLQFLLLRSYIETRLSIRRTTRIESLLDNLEVVSLNLFGNNARTRISSIKNHIVDLLDRRSDEEDDDEFFASLLSEYQNSLYLPARDFSDIHIYEQQYSELLDQLLVDNGLSLSYKRDSYNTKLKVALTHILIKTTDSDLPCLSSIFDAQNNPESPDKLINQYINAITLEFNSICENNPYITGSDNAIDYTYKIINAIDNLIKRIKLCVIITGNDRDAYTLFEVLNDRALEIDDLDLIKNLFYKWYCDHSGESDAMIDQCLEEVDKLWVEEIFSQELGIERPKIVSFLAAEYLTADETLKYADTERYRNQIENSYLQHFNNYTKTHIKNDIYVYLMVSKMVKGLAVRQKNDRVIESEVNSSTTSITFRAMNLLNALNQFGVLSAITNTIIRKFVDSNTTPDGYIDINRFDNYLVDLKNDSNHSDARFTYIHEISYIFWRLALLTNNAEKPRDEAKNAIRRINARNNSYDYRLSDTVVYELMNNYSELMRSWHYPKSDDVLKAKVLFINLFYTTKENNTLLFSVARHNFTMTNLHLDHLEANNPSEAAIPAPPIELYFKPNPNNSGMRREDYVNSIGNFMLLDQEDNNDKDNLPLSQALGYYHHMCPAGHWLIDEIESLITEDTECFVNVNGVNVPNENFFIRRREYLTRYFKAILSRPLGAAAISIAP